MNRQNAWLAIGWGEGSADMRIVRSDREMVQWLWEQCGPDHTGNEESTRSFWYSYLEDADHWTGMDGLPRWSCNIDIGETGHIEFQLLHGDGLRLALEPPVPRTPAEDLERGSMLEQLIKEVAELRAQHARDEESDART